MTTQGLNISTWVGKVSKVGPLTVHNLAVEHVWRGVKLVGNPLQGVEVSVLADIHVSAIGRLGGQLWRQLLVGWQPPIQATK